MKKEIEVVTEIHNKIRAIIDYYREKYNATEYTQRFIFSEKIKALSEALEEVDAVLDRLYDEDDDALEELIESIND